MENKVIINKVNEEKIKQGPSKLKTINYGKGKVLLTIDKVLIGVTAVFEAMRELPGFEYLKAMTTGNLVTKFNNWIASISVVKPNLTGLTPEEIFELGKDSALAASNASANGLGMVFSAILEFIVQHPTVTVLGITALFGILSIPFKFFINTLTRHGIRVHEEHMKELK